MTKDEKPPNKLKNYQSLRSLGRANRAPVLKALTVLTKLNLSSLLVPIVLSVVFALLGSYLFKAPLILTTVSALAGCVFNLLINWSVRIQGGRDNNTGDLAHPKYELMFYILLVGIITVLAQIFPNLKDYVFI